MWESWGIGSLDQTSGSACFKKKKNCIGKCAGKLGSAFFTDIYVVVLNKLQCLEASVFLSINEGDIFNVGCFVE